VNGKRHAGDTGSILRMFLRHAKKVKLEGVPVVVNIADITRAHVESYLASIADLDPKTERNRKIMIGAWLTWCMDEKMLLENVAERVKTRKVYKKRVIYHSFEEISRIMKAVAGTKFEPLILTAIYVGGRLSELLLMEGTDIDFDGRTLNVKDRTKTGFRQVPLMDELEPLLMALPRTGKLFPFKENGHFRRQLRKIWDKAKITKTGPQIFRHTFTTHLLLAKNDPYLVARIGGHDYKTMMRSYAGFKLGETPIPMTCAAHGIGKPSEGAKIEK
jgi:integrase